MVPEATKVMGCTAKSARKKQFTWYRIMPGTAKYYRQQNINDMAFTNRIENALIAAATAVIVTALVMTVVHFMTIRPLQKQIAKQNEVIVELAKIEKYHYEIRNDFEKIKPRDSQIIIDLDNKLEGLQINEADTAEVAPPLEEKKSFWRKLKFWK